MQVFFILFSVYFAVYQYINSKCLCRTHVKLRGCVKIAWHTLFLIICIMDIKNKQNPYFLKQGFCQVTIFL